jgi:hypothetical protein
LLLLKGNKGKRKEEKKIAVATEFLLPHNETTWAHFFNSFASFAPPLVLSPGAKIKN